MRVNSFTAGIIATLSIAGGVILQFPGQKGIEMAGDVFVIAGLMLAGSVVEQARIRYFKEHRRGVSKNHCDDDECQSLNSCARKDATA